MGLIESLLPSTVPAGKRAETAHLHFTARAARLGRTTTVSTAFSPYAHPRAQMIYDRPRRRGRGSVIGLRLAGDPQQHLSQPNSRNTRDVLKSSLAMSWHHGNHMLRVHSNRPHARMRAFLAYARGCCMCESSSPPATRASTTTGTASTSVCRDRRLRLLCVIAARKLPR